MQQFDIDMDPKMTYLIRVECNNLNSFEDLLESSNSVSAWEVIQQPIIINSPCGDPYCWDYGNKEWKRVTA